MTNNVDLWNLKPCPFCGSMELEVEENDFGDIVVSCESCFTEGPVAHSKSNAVALWNERKVIYD